MSESMNKLWGGRFANSTAQPVEEFTASISFDHHLVQEDILGSLAHVQMLEKCGIVSADEQQKIAAGLKSVAQKISSGDINFSIADEDIHMNIERLLHKEIGTVAGKLHTARSRNDQVALDLHLYLRKQVLQIIHELIQLQQALLTQAGQHLTTIMPGYTHLQRAQPVLLAHHWLAYVSMLQRDVERLQQSWVRINQMPLGAGALAGTGFPIDRTHVANLLGFDGIYENSMDAVSDRDFIIEFLSHAAIMMMHLSRLSEELILWSSQEFNFIELDDAYCTGSSIMPQKKNPDVPELIRGKSGRVYGALFNLLTIMKSLPLTYNKDLQEDKEPLLDTVKTLRRVLTIAVPLITTLKVNSERMLQATQQGFMNATDLADYLVKKTLPFREAHEIVGKIVQYAVQQQVILENIPLKQLQKFSALIDKDVYEILNLHNIVEARKVQGGTASQSVKQQLTQFTNEIAEINQWLSQKDKILQQAEALLK